MGIFSKINMEKRSISYEDAKNYSWKSISGSYTETDDLKEITYLNCLKIKSESVAKLNLEVKKETSKGESVEKNHYLYDKLKLRPNPYMTMVDCMKSFVTLGIHNGVSGMVILRDKNGKVTELYPVEIISITVDEKGILEGRAKNNVTVKFNLLGKEGACLEEDIIIFKDFTLNGINTKAIRELAKDTMQNNKESAKVMKELYVNGLTNKVAVQTSTQITDKAEIKKTNQLLEEFYNDGGKNGRFFVVPFGYNFQKLDMNLADSQFKELRELNAVQMASLMGIPPHMLGFLENSNNNSLEQQNLSFLNNTLLIMLKQIEQEMDYKLLTEKERNSGLKIRFNVAGLLRTDAQTQSNIITNYVKNGVYTINNARRILGLEDIEGGDTVFVASGTATLEQILNGDTSYLNPVEAPADEIVDDNKDDVQN